LNKEKISFRITEKTDMTVLRHKVNLSKKQKFW